MNEESEGSSDAPDGEGTEDSTAVEGATARVRRVLIQPLSGLLRPRGVSAGQHQDNLDRLARKLRHMDEPTLAGLAELCLVQAGKAAVGKAALPVCPLDGMILAWAYGLQAPPVNVSDYPASVMRSAMGRRAYDLGYGVELLRLARRHGPPPGAYSIVALQDEARDNRRRRDALREAVESGSGLTPNQDRWLKAWHDDALTVQMLIAEGDERREQRGAAA